MNGGKYGQFKLTMQICYFYVTFICLKLVESKVNRYDNFIEHHKNIDNPETLGHILQDQWPVMDPTIYYTPLESSLHNLVRKTICNPQTCNKCAGIFFKYSQVSNNIRLYCSTVLILRNCCHIFDLQIGF